MAEPAGIPLEFFIAMRQAVGLALPDPDERVCDAQDVSSAQASPSCGRPGFPEEGLLEITRVLGTRPRAGGGGDPHGDRRTRSLESGINEYELAPRNAEAAREFLPLMTPLLEHMLRLHLRDQVRNQAFGQAELARRRRTCARCGWRSPTWSASPGSASASSSASWAALVTRLTELALQTPTPPGRGW